MTADGLRAGALVLALSAPATAQDPLSAIDWLEENTPAALRLPTAPRAEPPVADSATSPAVESRPLDRPTSEAVGLLPMAVTGLPRDLWQGSRTIRLAELIAEAEPAVPAMAELLHTLLLAEADPPEEGGRTSLLVARLDKLVDLGVVDPALALVERAAPGQPQLFRRWFDLALLTGDTEAPCDALEARPALDPDLADRVLCAARAGDWPRAATIYDTGRALGAFDPREQDLLLRFLDPEYAETTPPAPPPLRPSPLEYHLFTTIGEPLPTTGLPRAYVVRDLGGDAGWRAQIEAAERLARVGAISENRLLGIYTERDPAASGGVWDRVEAVQRLDAALADGAPDRIAEALLRAWPQMQAAGLLVPVSQLFAERLAAHDLTGRAAEIAARAALLSEGYERAAGELAALGAEGAFLAAIARGTAPTASADLPHAEAVAAAFAGAEAPADLRQRLSEGRLGEVILETVALFDTGAQGNPGDLTGALAMLREVGLEDTARRAAMQVMLLDGAGGAR